ncbi:MAG: A/G-specific adenine glycosylase [Armatimonadetes bacterium]|nr:A/G-specific adenine glycosylase [Armatimonadota bacterium]
MRDFQLALLTWYDAQKRDLPWRRSHDIYAVWVSETMLQQTTVAAVLPYFERWMAAFPTLQDLARAPRGKVERFWAGLGYYSRCRRLHEAARQVADQGWPRTSQDWTRLPGVGCYTANAVASIAQNETVAVVDGNVERVFARATCSDATGAALRRQAQAWADQCLHRERPGDWNQALMELGALVCRPRDPNCPVCPVASFCQSQEAGTQSCYPRPSPKPKVVELEHEIWIPVVGEAVGLRQSPEGEWWQGLWGFPRFADKTQLEQITLSREPRLIGSFRHTVTCHRISVRVSIVTPPTRSKALNWFAWPEVGQLALPAPQKRAWNLGRIALSWTDEPPGLKGEEDELVAGEQRKAVEAKRQDKGQDAQSIFAGEPLAASKVLPSPVALGSLGKETN